MKYKFNKNLLDYLSLNDNKEYTVSEVISKLISKLDMVNNKFFITNDLKIIIDKIIINDSLTIGDLEYKYEYWKNIYNNGVTLSWINYFILNYFVELKFDKLNNFNIGNKVTILSI